MKPFTRITSAFLLLVSHFHAIRLALRWEVTINHVIVPLWLSAIALLVTATLAIMLWRESRSAS